MWFLFQQPDEFLDRFDAERRRSERVAQLTRALRGATPPFDGAVQRQLQQSMSRLARTGSAERRLAAPERP